MKTFTVSFFGHRYLTDIKTLEDELAELVRYLLMTHAYVEFLVGRNGDFDRIVSSAIRRAQKSYGHENSAHTLVLPYMTAQYRNNEESFYSFYDEIEVFDSHKTHFKAAITERNRAMIDRSSFVFFYVKESDGGASRAMEYARSIKKPYVNIAETMQKKAEGDAIMEEGAKTLFAKGYNEDEIKNILLDYTLKLLCEDMTHKERQAYFNEMPVKPLRKFWEIL